MKSPYNKNYKAYVFYSGSFYDDNIDEFLDSPVTYLYGSYDRSIRESINLADNNDIIINTVSIAAPYGANEYMDELVPKTGGKSYNDCDGIGTLINEVIKDLDNQKEAQRQGDYDGDGLSDGHELDGMIGDNGHIYYSNPYTTDVDHDTDHDHVPDNVEMGEYNPVTGTYKVLSDPEDPNRIPSDYYNDPKYIIGWSYGKSEVNEFEKKWAALNDYPILKVDELNNDWTDEMWTEFTKTNSFSRAAQTKKRDLIDSGISPDNIIIRRIDDKDSIDNSIYNIWKNEWTQYDSIQELHIYSHGQSGSPTFYLGHNAFIGDSNVFQRLNWSTKAEAFFYGCHTARIEHTDDDNNCLDTFAKEQGVVTYGNYYGSCFSEKSDEYVQIDNLTDGKISEDVYLACFGIPWEDVKDRDYEDATLGLMIKYGKRHISMIKYTP